MPISACHTVGRRRRGSPLSDRGLPVGFRGYPWNASVLPEPTLWGLASTSLGGPALLFPTDLTSFLDLIRQHGDAAYSFMFAYASSHSLLLALFAGYAAHSGALSLGTLIVVCWFGSFTATSFVSGSGGAMAPACSIVFRGLKARADRRPPDGPSLCLDDPVSSFPARRPRARGVCLRDIAAALVHFPRAQLRRGRPVVRRRRLGRLCLRSILGDVDEQCLFGSGHRHAGRVPRPVLVAQQETRADRAAILKRCGSPQGGQRRVGAVPTILRIIREAQRASAFARRATADKSL